MKKLFIIILVCNFLSCSKKDASEYGDTAYATAQNDFVRPKMTYPEETEFDWVPIANDFSKKDSIYSICGKGNTKNGFGVKTSFVFKCKLKYLGGDEYDGNSWKLIGDVELSQ